MAAKNLVGLNGAQADPTFVAVFNADRTVSISGSGYAAGTGELPTTATLYRLTEKQCAALTLGEQVLEFLRTGVAPAIEFGRPVNQPNAYTGPLDGLGFPKGRR